jgi:hypothetical protein
MNYAGPAFVLGAAAFLIACPWMAAWLEHHSNRQSRFQRDWDEVVKEWRKER